jgi:hypothetical protein
MPVRHSKLFHGWLIRLIIWLVPLFAAWWWLGLAEGVLHGLSILVARSLPVFFHQDVSEIVRQENQSWLVLTTLVIEHSDPSSLVVMVISKEKLLHMIFGFPFLWGLLLATQGKRARRIIWGTLLLIAISLIGIATDLWASLAVIINHQASFIDEGVVPPPFRVSVPPYPQWLLHLSSFARYLSILIVPMIAPVLIWVILCPRHIIRLLVSLRWRVRVKKTGVASI